MNRLITIIVLILFIRISYGQDLMIKDIDASAYPKIKINLGFTGKVDSALSGLKLFENNTETELKIRNYQSLATNQSERTVCFLIEASNLINRGNSAFIVKNAVIQALGQLKKSYKANVCYFGVANQSGKSIVALSAEFTSDYTFLKHSILDNMRTNSDSLYRTDLLTCINESLNFIQAKQSLSQQKQLIVIALTKTSEQSNVNIDSCIAKSLDYNIPVYAIHLAQPEGADEKLKHLCIGTYGVYKYIEPNAKETTDNETIAFFSTENQYIVEFTTKQELKKNYFEIHYAGEKYLASFTYEYAGVSFVERYFAVVVISFILSRKNKEILAEIAREKESQQYITGDKTPVLTVKTDGSEEIYKLFKSKMTIGRISDNDIVIWGELISGTHAVISNDNEILHLTDCSNGIGVFVNSERITETIIKPGDVITIGSAVLTLAIEENTENN